MKIRFTFALMLTLCIWMFPACDSSNSSEENKDKTTENTPPPDPNTLFENFETMFFQETLPFNLAYNYPPSGNSIAEEQMANFLGRKGEVYPAARFPLGADYQALVTTEASGDNFIFILNVFSKQGELTDHKQVAGPSGNEVMDAIFTDDASWAVTTRPRAEDTGEPIGEGSVTNYTVNSDGKITEK